MQERTEPPSVENLTGARRAIEAMLLVANDPTPVQLLAQLVELPVDLVQSMCVELAGEYDDQRRGFQLVEVAGGWRYQTHPDTHAYVERFALEGIPNRLSSAALETLAIVAYKQPISRGQIGAIRGVNVDGVLRTLVQRGYVDEQGRDDGPGQATLFGTTSFFLEQLGLMSLDDLPPLGDFVPSVEVLEALENTLRVDPEPDITVVDEPVTENESDLDGAATNGSAAGSTNGSQAEPAGGSAVEAIDGTADDEPVYEVSGDPSDSVIASATEPALGSEAADESPVMVQEAVDRVPRSEPPDRAMPGEEFPDELEVTADPEVVETDGPTATGAAGTDDARFPGTRSAESTGPAFAADPSQDQGGGLGRRSAAPADRSGSRSDQASPWSEALTNGHRGHPDDGDA